MTRDDINSLLHSKWNCKYHVVFAPKYRRMIIYRASLKTRLIKEKADRRTAARKPSEGVLSHSKGG